jgi:hypothetical protein
MIRLACCVPHCRRMIELDKVRPLGSREWLCREHFSAVPARRRRAYRKAIQRNPIADAPVTARLWLRIKAQAIEAAVGIGGA